MGKITPNNVKFTNNNYNIDKQNLNVLYKKIKNDIDDISVTFFKHNDTRKIMTVNKKFLLSQNNKKLSAIQIMEKLNTIKHDYGAKHYLIQ